MSDFLSKVLPQKPVTATLVNPRSLVIYSDLKVGKSAIASWLSLNRKALWLDLEDGSEALPGIKINLVREAERLNMKRKDFFLQLCSDLSKSRPAKYDYLLVDKQDQLENWADGWAMADYKQSIVGRSWEGSTITALSYGGWTYLYEKFEKLWNAAKSAAPHVIFFGSLKEGGSPQYGTHDAAKQGLVSSFDVDLGKRQRKLAVGDSDACAFMWRSQEDGANYLSFATKEKGAFAGNRIPRLEGRKFKISWLDKDKQLQVAWDDVFLPAVQ